MKDSTVKSTKNISRDLISEYAPLVKRIAHHLLGRLPPSVQAEDLIQSGMIGLIEAARNFDENKGASFSTYAGIRIRGAILDEIRKGDWAPRSVHRNTRMVLEAIRNVENLTGRDAKDSEVANYLGVSLHDYHAMVQDTNGTRIFGFDDIGLSDDTIKDGVSGNRHPSPLDGVQSADLKAQIAKGISELSQRESLVLALYYDEELNLKEVGDVLGVSESRISQIHSQAMLRLKSRLKDFDHNESKCKPKA